MELKKIILFFAFLFFACPVEIPLGLYGARAILMAGEVKETNTVVLSKDTKESPQQIGDFTLSGSGEKGKKAWDLAGKSADIYNEVVKLKEVVGNHYGDNDSINLTADNGNFNKESGVVHLEKNVVITTSSGAKLTTDSLDWDRKQQIISTLDKVNLEKADMNLSGEGAKGQTALKQVVLEKNVRLDINPADKQDNKKEKIMITCDGPLDIDYGKNIAVFNNNVKVEKSDLTIYSDKLEVYFTPEPQGNGLVSDKPQGDGAASDSRSHGQSHKPQGNGLASNGQSHKPQGNGLASNGQSHKQEESKNAQGPALISSSMDKIIALGNVRILRGENVSYSQEAVYTALDKKIILTGRPQIIIYQESAEKIPTIGSAL